MNKLSKSAKKVRVSSIDILLTVIIVIFAFCVRINTINSPIMDSHTWRQSEIYAMAVNFAYKDSNILNPLVFRIYPTANIEGLHLLEFPWYQYLLALIIRIFGNNVVYLRIFCISLAATTSVSVYVITKKYINRVTGFISALVFNLFPASIFWGRSLSYDFFAMTLSTLAIALLVSKSNKFKYLIIPSIFLGISISVKPSYAFLLFLYPLLIKLNLFTKNTFKKLGLMFLCIFLPFIVWMIRRSGVPQQILEDANLTFFISGNANYFTFLKTNNYIEFLLKDRLLGGILTPMGGVSIILMVSKLINSPNIGSKFLLRWLVLVLLTMVIFAWGNFNNSYYQVMILPIASILVGFFIYIFFLNLFKRNFAIAISGFVIFIFLSLFLWVKPSINYLNEYFHSDVRYNEFSYDINSIDNIVPKDGYIGLFDYSDTEDDPSLINRLERKGWKININKKCDGREWLDVINNQNYKLISYYIIQKDRYETNYDNYCGYLPIENTILNSDQRFIKVYDGEHLILIRQR